MATPEEVDVWVGLDVGKTDHFADVLDDAGQPLTARGVVNDETALEALLETAAEHGTPGLVIDQPGLIAQLAIAVAARRGVPVAYVPGLVMRRAADLYPGEAKTNQRDAFVLADTARTQRRRVHWLEVNDELLEELKVPGGFDSDLAADLTRTANRLRDAPTAVSPALERALGPKLDRAGVRRLLTACPTPTPLREAGAERIHATVAEASPRTADEITAAADKALAAQTVTLPGEAALGRVMAELTSLRTPESRGFYERKRAEGKHHNAAVMCLARRRCDVILATLRNRTPYRPPEPITHVAKAA